MSSAPQAAPPPPQDLATRDPIAEEITAGSELHRFYTEEYDPIYFDTSRDGRFNAPDASYGVLYCAGGMSGAFAETFLRRPGDTLIPRDLLKAKAYVKLEVRRTLRMVLFAGPGLARLGATAQVSHGGLPYDVPQAWSRALHAHRNGYDGLCYRSRHDDNEFCHAIFERARDAIKEIGRIVDLDQDWFWRIAEPYGVGLAP